MLEKLDSILIQLLLWIEFFSAIIGLLYLNKLKHNYWKWFSVYLVVIFIQELFWASKDSVCNISVQEYYAFFGIPIQFIFFYWLFGLKSLGLPKLFYTFLIIYLFTCLPIEVFRTELNVVYTVSYMVGSFLLTLLVILEFIKQIKNDDILKFGSNKMFYISVGVILFYIGTHPFWAFYDVLHQEPYEKIGDSYYLYFRISNCIMYILFIASFIWGKHPLK